MKKSFRVFLFFQILIATAIILFANRQLAQHYLVSQMETRAHQEIHRIVQRCASAMESAASWAQCNQGERKGDVLNPLNDFFLPCPARSAEPLAPECAMLSKADIQWQADQTGMMTLEDRVWHVATLDQLKRHPAVLMSDESLWHYLHNVWSLRDRNLIYVLPTVILMLVLLTFYMVFVVMRPIRQLERQLSTLDFKNINEKSIITVPYREFRSLASVYHDLLGRLYDSYENAQRFASDAAHELKTPLSILRGNVDRLLHDTRDPTAVQDYAQNLSDEVDRLVLITDKLLMLSRADSKNLVLDLSPFPLSDHLQALFEDASALHPSIAFQQAIEPDVIWHCDAALVEQLLNNLYSNALKYNQPQGGWVSISLYTTDTVMVLTMKNAARDVSPELPLRAFDRFYRGDASRSRGRLDGTGLGLSLCKEITQAHGGSIILEIEADSVVSIQLRVPLQPPA